MLYAKVIYSKSEDHVSASDRHTVVCADKFEFMFNAEGRPSMCVFRGTTLVEMIDLHGDVWVMNESGKTVSQYAIPNSLKD